MMRGRRKGGVSTWSPQDWPCYYSERTDLMLPSLGRGWRRNAASQSIPSILTSRLISRPESHREKLSPRWNCTTLHPKRMKISRDIIGRNKYLSCTCLTASLLSRNARGFNLLVRQRKRFWGSGIFSLLDVFRAINQSVGGKIKTADHSSWGKSLVEALC